jgi:hypothetical protein
LAVSVPLAIITLLAVGTGVFHHISQSLHAVSGVPGPIQSSLLRQLPFALAIMGIVLVLAVSGVILWRARGSGPSLPIAIGLISSVLVSPYVNFYDLSALVLAGWLILRLDPPRWQKAVTLGMYVPLYGAPIWPVVTLLCLCAWLVSLVSVPEQKDPGRSRETSASNRSAA